MEQIFNYMDTRGIPRKSIGYTYLADAIAECIREPTMPYHLNRWLTDYADKHRVRAVNVERTMRYAIKKDNPQVSVCEFIIEAGIQLRKKVR